MTTEYVPDVVARFDHTDHTDLEGFQTWIDSTGIGSRSVQRIHDGLESEGTPEDRARLLHSLEEIVWYAGVTANALNVYLDDVVLNVMRTINEKEAE